MLALACVTRIHTIVVMGSVRHAERFEPLVSTYDTNLLAFVVSAGQRVAPSALRHRRRPNLVSAVHASSAPGIAIDGASSSPRRLVQWLVQFRSLWWPAPTERTCLATLTTFDGTHRTTPTTRDVIGIDTMAPRELGSPHAHIRHRLPAR